MKKIKNTSVFLLTFVGIFLFSLSVQPFAMVEAVDNKNWEVVKLSEEIKPLIEAFQNYYFVKSIDVAACGRGIIDEKNQYVDYNVTLTTKLRAETIEELPHIQGMLHALNAKDLSECKEMLSDCIACESNQKLNRKQTQVRIYQLEQSIAFMEDVEAQRKEDADLTLGIRLIYNDAQVVNVLGTNEFGQFPVEEYYPETKEIMFQNGIDQVEGFASDIVKISNRSFSQPSNTLSLEYYYRNDAAAYAKVYTSNASSYCYHGKALMNTAYYNSSYTWYCHNDCANYMSQAIKYAGISTDSTWYVGSSSWIGVGSLINYFLNVRSRIQSTTFANCGLGGLMVFSGSTNSSDFSDMYHIVMCTRNDTISHAFSGHTNDRQNFEYVATSLTFFYSFTITASGSQYGSPIA